MEKTSDYIAIRKRINDGFIKYAEKKRKENPKCPAEIHITDYLNEDEEAFHLFKSISQTTIPLTKAPIEIKTIPIPHNTAGCLLCRVQGAPSYMGPDKYKVCIICISKIVQFYNVDLRPVFNKQPLEDDNKPW
jgi:hypothetical protein